MDQGCCGGSCGCSEPLLIDVSNVSLAEMMGNVPEALARSIQRLVRSLDDPNGVISAFSSFVE